MNILALDSKQREVSRLESEFKQYVEHREPLKLDPPSSNTGGNPPHIPLNNAFISRVKIDWLSFTLTLEHQLIKETIRCFFPSVQFTNRDKGMLGYPESIDLIVGDVTIGVFCFGADHGKNYVSFTGKGCSLWPVAAYPFIRECLETVQASINRIDLAFDTYRGEVTHEMVLQAYDQGKFQLREGGRLPQKKIIGSEIGGKNLGRTVNIGKRESSKFFRGYEKGLEVFGKLSDDFKERCTEPGQLVFGVENGAQPLTIANNWFRCEVEYSSKDKELTLDIITECESYFAGAYPFCASILGLADGIRPTSIVPSPLVDFEKMLLSCRNAYGNFVHTLRTVGFTNDEIVDFLDTGTPNSRLVSSGLVDLIKNDPAWLDSMRNSMDVPF